MDTLTFDIDGAVARIGLNRPAAGNTINAAMARDLLEAAVRCEDDARVRAVLLTGGEDKFCFGGDLKSFHAEGEGIGVLLKQVTIDFHGAVSRLLRMPKPLVVAVGGVAAGGGLSLALMGDVVLAADTAKFTLAYTAAGLSPDGGSTYLLPRLIGLRRTQELMYTNRTLSAAEAVEWGLITRAVPADVLMSEADKLVRRLAAGPTKSYGTVKTLLADTFTNGMETQMMFESDGIARNAAGSDGREGILAFLEKRAPEFSGK